MLFYTILFRAIEGIVPKLTSVNVFRYVWLTQLKHCREMIATVNLFGVSCTYLPSSRQLSTSSKKEETASKKGSLSPDDSQKSMCEGCGRPGHHVILKTPSISILGVVLTLIVKLTNL